MSSFLFQQESLKEGGKQKYHRYAANFGIGSLWWKQTAFFCSKIVLKFPYSKNRHFLECMK